MSLLEQFRMDGRVAVVTGSSKGIGLGIARGLADAGCDLVITARKADEVAAAAADVRARGVRAVEVVGDVTTIVPDLIAAAMDGLGRLDVWVSNAGGSDHDGNFATLEMPEWHWDAQIELNLRTHFLAARYATEVMGSGGSLIGIASTAALGPSPRYAAYGAAKAGMIQLAKTLAVDLAPKGIRSNIVSPGIVPTESLTRVGGVSDDMLPAMTRQVPLGRLGTPDDIAAAVLYLVSPAGSWVTGQNIVVSGGRG
ncbi:MAG: SDR family NAD(P)-dependent oxidoreductase [Acidimicrobiales bacterium]